MGVKSGASP